MIVMQIKRELSNCKVVASTRICDTVYLSNPDLHLRARQGTLNMNPCRSAYRLHLNLIYPYQPFRTHSGALPLLAPFT